MENLIRKRAMAITIATAMIMVAFLGLQVQAEDNLPDPIGVTVTDTFEPANDGNAYALLDTFEWFIPRSGLNRSNVSVQFTLGSAVDMDLNVGEDYFNETLDGWFYHLVEPGAALVGDHDWRVEISNATEAVNETGMITIWHPVILNSAFTLPTFYEDETTAWNITDTWLPMMDQADSYLTFGFPDGVPAGWDFTPVMDGNYTHWHVTPPANFTGWQHVNVSAEDTNGGDAGFAYNVFNLTVMEVNDAPVINEVLFEDMAYMPEWINVTELLNVTGVEGNFSWLVELEIDEDQMGVNFTVNVTDLETDHMNITTEINDDITEGIEVEWISDLHQYNVTIDENLNGHFLVNYSVMDDDDTDQMDAYVWILFTVAPVNDAPMGEFGTGYAEMIDKKTGEEVNVSVTGLSDVDGDDLTVIWKIDGTDVADWNEEYFINTWDAAGVYNVSAHVTDGTETVEIGYFIVTVTVANTAPTISGDITGPTEEVEEGKEFKLSVSASDAEGDDLTYTWTHNKDTNWEKTGNEITITDLEPNDYTFTVTVEDPSGETATKTFSVTIAEKEEEDDNMTVIIIIVVVIVLLVILLVIILVVMKGKKKEEEIPETPESMGEEMPEEGMGVEGGDMPMEGYEQPVEQPVEGYEQPVEGYEQPMEQPMAEQPPVEQPIAEQEPIEQPVPEQPPEQPVQEQPVPPEAPQQPPVPPQPQPPQPPQ
jgi:hypothetical protein